MTLFFVATACWMVVQGSIPVEAFLPLLGSVVTYYFVKRGEETVEAAEKPPAPFLEVD